MSAAFINLVLLTPLAAVISYYDVRYRRIPNSLVLATLVSGFAVNLGFGGWPGAITSLGGCALAFILMFVLHVFGAMGAGDVKLFAAIGSVTGAHLVLPTFFIVMMIGLVLAVYSMVRANAVRTTDDRTRGRAVPAMPSSAFRFLRRAERTTFYPHFQRRRRAGPRRLRMSSRVRRELGDQVADLAGQLRQGPPSAVGRCTGA